VIRAVIDTNVLVSGLLSPAGNEALIVLAIQQGLLRPCFSADILEEYAEVLARPKFAFPPDEIEAMLAMFRGKGDLFQPEGSAPALPDPGDAKFLHCAEVALAEYYRHRQQAAFSPRRLWRGACRERRRTARPNYVCNLTNMNDG
jgi:putative PIN family toxin of toxin-antitoxin system